MATARADNVPLIYVGFGSVTVPDASAVTRAIYGAVVGAGVRAIVAKGWSERVTVEAETIEAPKEVYVLQSVPHDWLFPQIDAVCHHGGAGTTGISLRFGLPTLIHPFFGGECLFFSFSFKVLLTLKKRIYSLTAVLFYHFWKFVDQMFWADVSNLFDDKPKKEVRKVNRNVCEFFLSFLASYKIRCRYES